MFWDSFTTLPMVKYNSAKNTMLVHVVMTNKYLKFLSHLWCAYAISMASSVICVFCSALSKADMKAALWCKYFAYMPAWIVPSRFGGASPPKVYFHTFNFFFETKNSWHLIFTDSSIS